MKRTKSLWTVIAAVFVSLALAGCSGANESTVGDMDVDVAPAQDGGLALPEEAGGDESSERLVIIAKTLRLEVDDTADAVDQIRELTRDFDGTVVNMRIASGDEWVHHYDEYGNFVGDGTAVRGWVTVKVPTDTYEDFVADVGSMGDIVYQSESTDDVTQEHVDMTARLENLQAQEARLREFFEAATDVDDMLAVEQELGRVRGEIESLDAQITYLERQAAMATVSVELTEPNAIVEPQGTSWGFAEAVGTGVRGAVQVLTVTLTVIIATSPLWLLALILFFQIRARVRRRRDVRAEQAAAAAAAASTRMPGQQGPPLAAYPPPAAPPGSASAAATEQPATEQPIADQPVGEARASEEPETDEPTQTIDDSQPDTPEQAPPRD